jgi:hypothetical protein
MMSEVTEEQWHVQIEAGDVRLWTLDQLDAAFKAELVDESTFVLEVGQTEWMQLGTLLGGGEEVPEAAPAATDDVASAPVSAYAATVAFTGQAPAPQSMNVAPVLVADAAAMGPYSTSSPYSTAPMAADVGDDFEPPASFRGSKKRPVAIFVGVALLAAGVAVFASVRGGLTAETPAPEVAAAAAVAVAPPPSTPPAAATDSQPAAAATSLSARLTQDQLQKLADADKVQQAKIASLQKARASSAPHHGSSHKLKEKGPFHTGGDKYDPLNAKL